jgi:integrase
MVAYRKLPSGLWQASVTLPQRLPSGKPRRVTKTHQLKGVVKTWGEKLEQQIAAGKFTDPRAGDMVLADWYALWRAGRSVAGSTQRRDDSHWRVHIEPRWSGYPLNTITKPEVRLWIKQLHENSVGTPTIRGVMTTFSAMMSAAFDSELLPANPLHGIKLPRADAKPIFWWTKKEAAEIVTAVNAAGHNPLMVDLDFHCGLRLGELLGMKRRYVHEVGDRLLISVAGVQTRDGWREYPKSVMSRRVVPVPPHLAAPMREHLSPLAPDGVVFPAPGGGAWDDRNWSRRVFDPAVAAAGVPRGTPHDMRHTAASWLVQAGVDLYVVQQMLGHESFRTTQRYAHLAPDAFEKVIDAWEDMERDDE